MTTTTTTLDAPAHDGTSAPTWTWALQLVAAAILLQTLYFKFAGAPETVAIFEQLGVEPWGRYATAFAELVVGVALLVPRVAALGGLAAAGVMAGAIGSHLFVIGIEHDGDGGALFAMAWVTLLAGLGVAWLRRRDLPRLRN